MNDSMILAIAGLLVLLSWIGLGAALFRLLRLHKRIRAGWPLLAATGMSILLFYGGILNVLSLTSRLTLNSATIAGLLLAVITLWHNRQRTLTTIRHAWTSLLPLTILAGILYVTAAASTDLNTGDDQETYMVFPRQMLQSGTLIAPFSVRRLGTYGGQQFLQAQWMATVHLLAGPEVENLCTIRGHLVDAGLCTLLAAGLLWTLIRPRTNHKRMLATLATASFLMLPIPHANTHAEASGIVLFLALAQLLPLFTRTRKGIVVTATLVGLIAAGAATLRMNFAAAAASLIILACVPGFLRRTHRTRSLSKSLLAISIMIAALAPWAILLSRSSGSLFYPLFHGFERGTFLGNKMPTAARLHWATLSVLFPPILVLLFPAFLALRLARWRDAVPLCAAALFMTAALAWSFTNQDTINIYRLSAPALIACAYFSLAIVLKCWNCVVPNTRCAAIVMLLAIPCVDAFHFSEAFRHSYPAVLLPVLIFGAIALSRRSALWRGIAALILLTLVICTAIQDDNRVADNGTIFFLAAAAAFLLWAAISSGNFIVRSVTLLAALVTAAIWFIGWSIISGAPLVAATLALAAGIGCLWRLMKGERTDRRLLFAMFVAGIGLYLTIMNFPYLVTEFGEWICVAGVGIAIWITYQEVSPLIRIGAIVCFIALATVHLPAFAPYCLHTIPLGIAALSVGAVSLMRWLRLHNALIALMLLAGAGVLINEEVAATNRYLHATNTAELQSDAPAALYIQAQLAIPARLPIFALTADPVRFDFGRNIIDAPDYAGLFASPPPGLPVRGSFDDLHHYLTTLGIHDVIIAKHASAVEYYPALAPFLHPMSAPFPNAKILFESREMIALHLED